MFKCPTQMQRCRCHERDVCLVRGSCQLKSPPHFTRTIRNRSGCRECSTEAVRQPLFSVRSCDFEDRFLEVFVRTARADSSIGLVVRFNLAVFLYRLINSIRRPYNGRIVV